MKGCISALGKGRVPIYRPLLLQIDDRDVAGGTGGQRSTGQAKRFRWAGTHPMDERGNIDEAFTDDMRKSQPQRGLQPDDPVGRIREGLLFFIVVVGSMVTGEHVQGPIG